jgi:hypothetical protein
VFVNSLETSSVHVYGLLAVFSQSPQIFRVSCLPLQMENKVQFANTSSVRRALQPMQKLRMWTSENMVKLIEDLRSLPCLWDVQSAEYKTRNKKVHACDTLATKYGASAVDVEKKIQALKTQFRMEHKKLVGSKRSGSSLKKALWFGYEPVCQKMFSIPRFFSQKVSSPPPSPICSSASFI